MSVFQAIYSTWKGGRFDVNGRKNDSALEKGIRSALVIAPDCTYLFILKENIAHISTKRPWIKDGDTHITWNFLCVNDNSHTSHFDVESDFLEVFYHTAQSLSSLAGQTGMPWRQCDSLL